MPPSDPIDPFELAAIEARADAADVPRLAAECRRLRRALADSGSPPPAPGGDARPATALRRAEDRADAAELELERAHRELDRNGVPREVRRPGERDPLELGLAARLRLALGEADPDEL